MLLTEASGSCVIRCSSPALTRVPLVCPAGRELQGVCRSASRLRRAVPLHRQRRLRQQLPVPCRQRLLRRLQPPRAEETRLSAVRCLRPAVRDIWLVPLRLLVFSSPQHHYFRSKSKGICVLFLGQRNTWKPSTCVISHRGGGLFVWLILTKCMCFVIRDENVQSVMNASVFLRVPRPSTSFVFHRSWL